MWRTTRTPVNHRLHALSTDTRNREYSVADPQAPAPILRRLAKDKEHTVTRTVAGNPATAADVLVAVAGHEKPQLRWEVAVNPATPPPILTPYAAGKTVFARVGIEENLNAHRGSCCPRGEASVDTVTNGNAP